MWLGISSAAAALEGPTHLKLIRRLKNVSKPKSQRTMKMTSLEGRCGSKQMAAFQVRHS